MAYGSTAGLKIYFANYATVITDATIVTAARTAADEYIDTMILGKYPSATLPLADSSQVDDISDMLTACKLYKGLYLQQSPNESPFDSTLCDEAVDMLDDILEGDAIAPAAATVSVQPKSNTQDQDRVMSVTTTSDGSVTSGDYEGTIDKW